MAKKNEPQIENQIAPLPEIYTNAALTNFSPYEFELTLGLRSANYDGVRPLANVRMSPQFAKEFAEVLLENVKIYEEHYGEIIVAEESGKKVN
jgi:hypothetical protein